MTKFTLQIAAVRNDFNASMKGGTNENFVWLPIEGGYADGVRADRLDGAVVRSRHVKINPYGGYATANERKSATTIDVDLPAGAIRLYTGGPSAKRLGEDGEWQDIRYIGPVRRNETFFIAVEIDGEKVELPGGEPTAKARQAYESERAAEAAREERAEKDRQWAEKQEKIRIEREAMAEIAAEEAAIAGYPALEGTEIQIKYAEQIRAAYAKTKPAAEILWEQATAKYWIENHRSSLS